MKRKIIIMCLLFVCLLLFMGQGLSTQVVWKVAIIDHNSEIYNGRLLGFRLPGYIEWFDEYFFVYNKEWRGDKIFFRQTPKIEINPEEVVRHPVTRRLHRIANVKIGSKEKIYYINNDAYIHYRDSEGEKKYPIYEIQELRIYY